MSTSSGSDGDDNVANDLDVGQVRWYFSKACYSLGGPELPARGELSRFSEVDSAALEQAYRRQQEQLDRVWWQEVAELAAEKESRLNRRSGPGSGSEQEDRHGESHDERLQTSRPPSAPAISSPGTGAKASLITAATWQLDDDDEGEEYSCVLVRGGYQEVDLKSRCLKYCYWPGSRHRVQRGSWFVERGGNDQWSPIRENLADQLEEAFRNRVWERRIARIREGDIEGVKIEITTLDGAGLYALMASPDEMYLCHSNTMGKMWRGLRGVRIPGDRLRRGYCPEAYLDQQEAKQHAEHDSSAREQVTSLVLVTHGIGQNIEGSNIAHDTDAMRDLVRVMYRQEAGERGGRVEVLPVQWRKNLSLDVDALAEKIMPGGIKALRSMIHQSAAEVLFYLTPLHHRDIIASVSGNLNDVYSRFIRRNPAFQGNVNIVAHSLGSVLCYDILSHQPSLYRLLSSTNEQMMAPDATHNVSDSQSSLENLPGTAGICSMTGDSQQPISGKAQERSSNLGEKQVLLESLEQQVLALKLEIAAAEEGSSTAPSTASRRIRESPSALYVPAFDTTTTSSKTSNPGLGAPLDLELRYPSLSFSVDKFILLGSPLGLFLALRGVNPSKGRSMGSPGAKEVMPFSGGYGDALPACKRMYNIYHPFDPCAYRLEPLAIEDAEKRRPVYIPYRGGKRIHIGTQEFVEDVGYNMLSTLASMKVNTSRALSAIRGKKSEEVATEDEALAAAASPRGPYNPIWRLTDGQECTQKRGRGAAGRLDFVLQDAPTENQYLSAIMAHFSYWTCPDTALFIARAIADKDVIDGKICIKQLERCKSTDQDMMNSTCAKEPHTSATDKTVEFDVANAESPEAEQATKNLSDRDLAHV